MGGPSSRHARRCLLARTRPTRGVSGRHRTLACTAERGGGSGLARRGGEAACAGWGGAQSSHAWGRPWRDPHGRRGGRPAAPQAAGEPRSVQHAEGALRGRPHARARGAAALQERARRYAGATRRLPRRAVCRAAQAAPRVPRAVVIPCHVNPVRPAHAGPCEAREGGGREERVPRARGASFRTVALALPLTRRPRGPSAPLGAQAAPPRLGRARVWTAASRRAARRGGGWRAEGRAWSARGGRGRPTASTPSARCARGWLSPCAACFGRSACLCMGGALLQSGARACAFAREHSGELKEAAVAD